MKEKTKFETKKNKRDLFLSYTMLIIITQIFQHSIMRTMTSTTTTTTATTTTMMRKKNRYKRKTHKNELHL